MKKLNFWSLVMTLALCVGFTSCGDDDNKDNNNSTNSITQIKAENIVAVNGDDMSEITKVELRLKDDNYNPTKIAEGTFNNNSFTIPLPVTLAGNLVEEIPAAEGISNAAKTAFVEASDFYVVNQDGAEIGKVQCGYMDASSNFTYLVQWFYANTDVTINTTQGNYTMNLNLKKGWNEFYRVRTLDNNNEMWISTKPDVALTWYYRMY